MNDESIHNLFTLIGDLHSVQQTLTNEMCYVNNVAFSFNKETSLNNWSILMKILQKSKINCAYSLVRKLPEYQILKELEKYNIVEEIPLNMKYILTCNDLLDKMDKIYKECTPSSIEMKVFIYSTIPSSFNYFITADQSREYVDFMEELYSNNKITFFESSESAFSSPLYTTFLTLILKHPIRKIIDASLNNKLCISFFLEICDDILERVKKYRGKLPCHVKLLLERFEQKVALALLKLSFENALKDPSLYGIVNYYETSLKVPQEFIDFISNPYLRTKFMSGKYHQVTENFYERLYQLLIIDNYASYPLIIDSSVSNLSTVRDLMRIRLIDSFDMALENLTKFTLPKKYEMKLIANPKSYIKHFPDMLDDRTIIKPCKDPEDELRINLREFLKNSISIPLYTQMPAFFCHLDDFLLYIASLSPSSKKPAVYKSLNRILENSFYQQHCNLSSEDLEIFQNIISRFHIHHENTEKRALCERSLCYVLIAFYNQNYDERSKTIYRTLYKTEKDYIFEDASIIVQRPMSIFRNYFHKFLDETDTRYISKTDNLAIDIARHRVYKHLPYSFFILNRPDLRAIDASFSRSLREDASGIIDSVMSNAGVFVGERGAEFSAELDYIVSNSTDAFQKLTDFSALLNEIVTQRLTSAMPESDKINNSVMAVILRAKEPNIMSSIIFMLDIGATTSAQFPLGPAIVNWGIPMAGMIPTMQRGSSSNLMLWDMSCLAAVDFKLLVVGPADSHARSFAAAVGGCSATDIPIGSELLVETFSELYSKSIHARLKAFVRLFYFESPSSVPKALRDDPDAKVAVFVGQNPSKEEEKEAWRFHKRAKSRAFLESVICDEKSNIDEQRKYHVIRNGFFRTLKDYLVLSVFNEKIPEWNLRLPNI